MRTPRPPLLIYRQGGKDRGKPTGRDLTKSGKRLYPGATQRRVPSSGQNDWPQHRLDRLVQDFTWLLLRAGQSPDEIQRALLRATRLHAAVRPLKLPDSNGMGLARILTYWQNDPDRLDQKGRSRWIPIQGAKNDFASLVRRALPRARPDWALRELTRLRLVSTTRAGCVRMLSNVMVPRTADRAHALAIVIRMVEGLLQTNVHNLRLRNPIDSPGRFCRTTYVEQFDNRFLKEHDQLTRRGSMALLAEQDAWLRQREQSNGRQQRRTHSGHYVGVCVFGYRSDGSKSD